MGRHIGTLGRQREPLDLEFGYFGATIRVHPQATDAVELEFLRAADDVDMSALDGVDMSTVDAVDPERLQAALRALGRAQRAAHQAVLDALHQLIHPDDFAAYWRLGMEHGQQIRDRMADVRAITTAVVEATTDFPTGRPAGSQPGPATTPPGSGDASLSPAAPASDLDVALALERGRPDLQEFYVMQAEEREQAEREAREKAAKDRAKLATAGLAT
jgi:hypothetical protein